MKKILICGSAGFIGSHLVKRLQKEGCYVIGADIQNEKYCKANEFYQYDLRNFELCRMLIEDKDIEEIYQLAADMGGAEFIFTKENDADVMRNSAQINLNIAECAIRYIWDGKLLYSSSACIYPQQIQETPDNEGLKESDALPANPDSCYGFEKLFSELLYDAYHRNYHLDIRIARFHNIFGEEGTWDGIRAKAPAAICRKVAMAKDGDTIEVFGDGEQTRSFLHVPECIDGVLKLMDSKVREPLNIGSDEMVSINQLVDMVAEIAGKKIYKKYLLDKPQGVRGRNSNNDLIKSKLNWSPTEKLYDGLVTTYNWINKQVNGTSRG